MEEVEGVGGADGGEVAGHGLAEEIGREGIGELVGAVDAVEFGWADDLPTLAAQLPGGSVERGKVVLRVATHGTGDVDAFFHVEIPSRGGSWGPGGEGKRAAWEW